MPTKWLQERTNGSKNEHGIPPHRVLCGEFAPGKYALREDTGVPRSKEKTLPEGPTAALCLGTCGDPRGGGVSYERGTPVEKSKCH